MLLTEKKPINFTADDVELVESLIKIRNSKRASNEKKITFSSLVRESAIKDIAKQLKDIERGK